MVRLSSHIWKIIIPNELFNPTLYRIHGTLSVIDESMKVSLCFAMPSSNVEKYEYCVIFYRRKGIPFEFRCYSCIDIYFQIKSQFKNNWQKTGVT